MRKTGTFLVILSILLLVMAAIAQAQGPIGRNFVTEVKDGQAAQWEAAYKEHIDWHRSNNDTWSWTTYQIESGPRLGQYFVRTGGHEWADFDAHAEMDAKDGANHAATAGKHTKSAISWFDRIHRNLSRTVDGEGPVSILEYTRVVVKPSKVGDFLNAMSKFHAAFEKTSSPARFVVVQTESGGRTSNFAFVGLHKNWASLEQDPMAIIKMMEEVYGRQDAAAIGDDFWSCVEEMETFTMRSRPDLSYDPDASTSNE